MLNKISAPIRHSPACLGTGRGSAASGQKPGQASDKETGVLLLSFFSLRRAEREKKEECGVVTQ